MKQVSIRLRDGSVAVVDVPPPTLTADGVLVDVRASVLSVGTERSKVQAGREGLIGKARARPDQARQVIEKARRDGLRDTVQAVRTRLDQPSPLGYSAAGVVLAVGSRVRGLTPGTHVACGGEQAVHADVIEVPGNLCVTLPDGVDFEAGAFATIGSVAMHGVRQADVRVGERVAIIGLGLVGQLTGQILRAAGCLVVGIDLSESLVSRARELRSIDVGYLRSALDGDVLPGGASDCDAVIVTAATSSSDPVRLAARMLRDRGRVVIVGDVHVDLPRAPYYEREIDLRFSRSYGPGRYDREYEQRGLDYPIGYVRWTEQRNMGAFLELVASGRIDIGALVASRVPVQDAAGAYERLLSARESPLGIVLQYGPSELSEPRLSVGTPALAVAPGRLSTVNVIGAGSFAQRILIPGFKSAGFTLGGVASAKGLSARAAADRFGFDQAVAVDAALADPKADLIAIATRHSTHAALAASALRAGKAVYVEKPPCLTLDELTMLRNARAESAQPLFVGFNRRHAPLAIALRDHVRAAGTPIEMLYRVNAGSLAPDHWLNDPQDGGGRLLGEGCHFVDFACWLIGAKPASVVSLAQIDDASTVRAAESFTIAIKFADGSLATIVYAVRGASGMSKEYVEAHAGGRSAVLDDYRTLTTFEGSRRRRQRARSADKGHRAQLMAIRSANGASSSAEPDPLDSMEATLQALNGLQQSPGVTVSLPASSGGEG